MTDRVSDVHDFSSFASLAKQLMALLRSGAPERALALARQSAGVPIAAADVQPAGRIAQLFARALPDLPPVRVAFGGDVTLGDLVGVVGWGLLQEGFRLEPLVLPFGTWEQQVHTASSELHRFGPEFFWVFTNPARLRNDELILRGADVTVSPVAEELLEYMHELCIKWQSMSASQVIVNNVVPEAWRTIGNLESSVVGARAHAARYFNLQLASRLPVGVSVFDMEYVASCFGLCNWHDKRLYFHSKHPFSMYAHGWVGTSMARHLCALKGRSKKCVVLDLDNTLWGGVVGDDGVEGIVVGPDGGAMGEAYQSFQAWLLELNRRGVILAVCSKNDDLTARRPFLEKPGMVLKLEQFASFKANWRNKADNLRDIATELNLGLDALVFVDDNPAERALIRQELREVSVLELPTDPAGFVEALARGRWFETASLSVEDVERAKSYRENAARRQAQNTASDLPSYLRGLAMVSKWAPVDASTLARATQLINKTNQFHLTGTRYSEPEVAALSQRTDRWIGQFSLSDRFGDHGITSIVILAFEGSTAVIDTWVMSCRVFSRTFEHFIFNTIRRVASSRRATRIEASYHPSPKNGVVCNLYRDLGGVQVSAAALHGTPTTTWRFELQASLPALETFVAESDAQPTLIQNFSH